MSPDHSYGGASRDRWVCAKTGRGPHRYWFTRNAEVRIVGCNTSGFARRFAGIFLRRGARAFGTRNSIEANTTFVLDRQWKYHLSSGELKDMGKKSAPWCTSASACISQFEWDTARGRL
jgi:hypothetical protein